MLRLLWDCLHAWYVSACIHLLLPYGALFRRCRGAPGPCRLHTAVDGGCGRAVRVFPRGCVRSPPPLAHARAKARIGGELVGRVSLGGHKLPDAATAKE